MYFETYLQTLYRPDREHSFSNYPEYRCFWDVEVPVLLSLMIESAQCLRRGLCCQTSRLLDMTDKNIVCFQPLRSPTAGYIEAHPQYPSGAAMLVRQSRMK